MDEDDSFGLIQPTLIQQIKKILDEYPDDGQILKELIQNAEDAGASEMKFLIDHHYYETTNLQYPELKKFQGPALYAYNNAKFTEGDWKGLGMLCDSIKVKDPTKVGRFGLGFKSVFHMTDLPSVVSGKSLGIIDPHEKCFSNESGRTSGMRVKLNDPITCKNEFAPYKNVFDCTQDTFQRGFYDGTLFRLPFRHQTSKLSNTLYSDDEKIQGLFESFKSDAHLILLFLMNLERIEIYERKPGVQDAEKLFSVALSKDCKASVKAARCSFRAKMDQKTSDDVTETYVVKIETLDCQSGKSSKYSYAVTHFLNRDNLSSKMEELVKDESLSYMPRVGVAFPLNNVDEVRKPSGHVFCFLPLPVEAKSLTGLPVHVNGFFALSQNRRHLKWRSADQKCTTDKSLDWNEGLLAEVLPKAYAELVFYLISERMLQVVVYSAWPDVSTVDIKWVIFLKPFFNLLFTARELLYSRVGGGCWCSLKDVRFDNITRHSDTRDSVIKLLNDVGHKIVTVPNHVQLALKMYYSGNFKEITPSLVRKSLKNNSWHYIGLSREKKLFLLKYILSDSKFKQLEGLHLLPLSTKEFTKFNNKCSDVIYVDSPEHPRSLLPGMDAMFLDTDVDDYIKNQLRIATLEGCAQLCHFDEIELKKHLRKALPADWTSSEVKSSGHVEWYPGHGQHPPRSWLENMWRYLIKHFNGKNDLDEFLGIPLIPLQDTSSTKKRAKNRVKLACIQKPSTLLLSNFHRDQLEKSVLEKVSAFGVTVVESLPEFVISHRSLVPYYINPPRPRGVLTALFMVFRYDPRCMSLDVRALRKLFSQISSPTASEINFLKKLKLFDTCCHPALAVPSRPVTVIEVPKGAPLNDLPPVRWCFEMIDVRGNSSRTLGEMLGIEPMDLAVLVKKMLEDAWSGKYSNKEIDDLVKYTMDHFRVFSRIVSNEIKHLLATIPFVTSYNNTRKKPAELFDPQDNIVTEMFLYEPDKFPKAGCYYSKPFVLHRLKDLGLKAREDVRPQDILSSAKMVNQIGSLEKAVKKSTAILRHLDKNPTLLKAPLLYELYSIPWIPVVSERSESYPCTLKLNGSDGLACPEEVTSVRYQLLVGSINPLVDDTSAADISRNFGWNRAPSIYDVIAHLKNVISSYHEEEKNTYVIVIKEIYRYLAEQNVSDVIVVLNEERIHQWIWNGNGFSSADEMIETHEVMDLQPYLYPLPMEVREFTSFFNECGMKHEPDSNLLLNVLQRINESHLNCSSKPQNEVRRDLRYCIQILDALKPKDGETLDYEIRGRLLVPVDVEEDTRLEMALIEDCTYCDREWLQKGHEVSDIDETDDEKIKFVHRNISNATAEILNVPALMSRILDADELEMGESFGQSESLLDRLKGLLEGYTDGLSVPKELIQNADDAGATEVRFLYDERTNDNAMTNLIDEGMKECQGPALWTYNNAIFTEEDFQNVVKLNAATKEYNTSKIGRFGLGFNSVYNLTDVPSFVSGNSIVILDPHTEYLGKAIRDRRKPGMRMDTTQKRLFDKLQNQFKPYNGIFGCDLSPGNKDKTYNGTLFRFPLRTASQAKKSKIKNLCYDDNQVKELLRILLHGAESLLLFTQNVLTVGVYHLSDEDQDPSQPVELFSISKSCEDVIHRLPCEVSLSNQAQQLKDSEQEFVKQSSILKASTERLKTLNLPPSKVLMTSSLVIRSCCKLSERGKGLLQIVDAEQNSKAESLWLVHSCMVGGKVLTLSRNIKGISPVAGAAAKLEMMSCGKVIPLTLIQNLDDVTIEGGKVFCFLPLPIHSGLPVHINGCFAVDDSRRHLRERTEDDKSDHGAEWNQELMSQVIVQAFLGLLQDAKSNFSDEKYHFHTLWPTISNLTSQWHHFVESFYQTLCYHGKGLELFSDGKTWSSIDNIIFLDPSFKSDENIGSVAFDVFKFVSPESKLVIDMPRAVFHTFKCCGLEPRLQISCYAKNRFFREVVFAHLDLLEESQRNRLVLYALDDHSEILQSLVREYRCIPCSPSGNQLKYPKELIHPNGKAAVLYELKDGKFPYGDKFCTAQRLFELETLGMRKDDLDWEEIVDRAKSVKALESYEKAITRTRQLIDFINTKIVVGEQVEEAVKNDLQKIAFLPFLMRPNAYPCKWKGDDYMRDSFLSAKDLHLSEMRYLVGTSSPILNDEPCGCGSLTSGTEYFLGLKKSVSLHQLKEQMLSMIESGNSMEHKTCEVFQEFSNACVHLYGEFQNCLNESGEDVVEFLSEIPFILGRKSFLMPRQVAFSSTITFEPYLSQVLPQFSDKFSGLLKRVGVQESFQIQDYVSTLENVFVQYKDSSVAEHLPKVVEIISEIEYLTTKEEISPSDSQSKYGTIYLPDSNSIMRPSGNVCIKDCYWMPDEEGILYANEKIPPKVCLGIGVNSRRQHALQNRSSGIEFGQMEKLTNRLKRILTGYPCDSSVMKELVQNADDAKASKICFIKDPRHHRTERVFEKSWKPLQGPALCVYNDAPFRDIDIKGIQKLGEGSKGEDPNKTGQYGVGFNAVYHLTDAPSFLSKGDEIGEVMCIFDPNLKYVPLATEQYPGRRYDDLPYLRQRFTDVFPCFLEKQLQFDKGTIFRFPLRTVEMAETSEISYLPMDIEKVDKLLEEFKGELLKTLLFVKSIKEISICDVDESGSLFERYHVRVSLSKEDTMKRDAFTSYVKHISDSLCNGSLTIDDVALSKVSYVLDLTDSEGECQKWLVSQQIGFSKDSFLPQEIHEAYHKGNLGLLPRGGVAVMIDKPMDMTGNAFCFLPLPFQTGLPAHLNGHFALDHEARRSLWTNEKGDYRSIWNQTLLKNVVASCYVEVLDEVRKYKSLMVIAESKTFLQKSREDAEHMLSTYAHYFPLPSTCVSPWKELASEVYLEMDKRGTCLLPVLRQSSAAKGNGENMIIIEWLPPTGKGREEAFFDNLPKTEMLTKRENQKSKDVKIRLRLREILLSLGFNLVFMPMDICTSFQNSGVHVSEITPLKVISFFATYKSAYKLCRIKRLPQSLTKTPFQDVTNLVKVLQYCKKEKTFCPHLKGLPLLLTEDGNLRVFDQLQPVFNCEWHALVPHSKSLFMHHSLLKMFESDSQMPFLKVFDIEEFARLLPKELCEAKYKCNLDYIEWNPSKKENKLPTKHWLCNVWRFLSLYIEKQIQDDQHKKSNDHEIPYAQRRKIEEEAKKTITQDALKPVMSWCLLPAVESVAGHGNERHFLVPLSLAHSLIIYSYKPTWESLKEILKMLLLPEINFLNCGCWSLRYSTTLERLVANMEDPLSILSVLLYKLSRDASSFHSLDNSECRRLLEYFNDHIDALKEDAKDSLKNLPFFVTINDAQVSIENKRTFALSRRIPLDGIIQESNIVLLKIEASLEKLYAYLGCSIKDEVEVYYTEEIFTRLGDMTEEERLNHLIFIQDFMKDLDWNITRYASDPDLKKANEMKKEKLSDALTLLKFLPREEGVLKPASAFFDPSVEVFKVMFCDQPERFPREPFCNKTWLPFLRQVGLIHKVTEDQYLDFAREVEVESSQNRHLSEATRAKSEALISYLFDEILNGVDSCDPNDTFLLELSTIRYIFPNEVSKELQNIYAQHGIEDGALPCICFKESVLSNNEPIAWTSSNLLPDHANPFKKFESEVPKKIINLLGVLQKPSIDMVTVHCQNICSVLSQIPCKSDGASNIHHHPNRIMKIMKSIYRFLLDEFRDKKANSCGKLTRLSTTRCLVVDDGGLFIYPKQAVIELKSTMQIRPYLFQIPLELGGYAELFERLGTTKFVTPRHYSMVLRIIHDESKGDKLLVNEKKNAFQATANLFEILKEKKECEDLQLYPLYLPGIERSPDETPKEDAIKLCPSSEIVYSDSARFKDRIKKINAIILVKFSDINLQVSNDEDLLSKLPKNLRPKNVSSLVCESLVEGNELISRSATTLELDNILTHVQFANGIIRMIKHDKHQKGIEASTDIEGDVKKSLSCIKVYSASRLRTELLFKGSVILGSEADVTCFEKQVHEENQLVWRIYIKEGSELIKFSSRVAQIVDRITGSQLGDMLVHLSTVLSMNPNEIRSFLDELEVREDNATQTSYLPEPGSFVHLDDHHVLVDAFTLFYPGDYVGYELDDPILRDENGTPTYIYAVIIEEIESEDKSSPYTRRYRIDIGKRYTDVDAVDLYQIHCHREECTELETSQKPSGKQENPEEVKWLINEALEHAWTLTEVRKRKIIKRLLLAWHPDKNSGNEEFCTEIFQFLRAEIERLEKNVRPSRIPNCSPDYSGFYDSFCSRYSSRASRHGAQRNFSPFFNRKNPQIEEASRWYKQASADLEAASNDMQDHKPSYEWACFKCHQAAEKSLKAAQYSQDANKSTTHNLSEIAISVEDSELESLASSLERCLGESTRMRYPDRVCYPNIPHNMYTKDIAEQALEIASAILNVVKSKFVN